MAKLKIIKGADNPILRAVSEPVKKFDGALKKFARDLKETMDSAKGLGIAAPQVGKNVRVFIVTLAHGEPGQVSLAMVNPEIVWHSDTVELGEEGCLSLPGQYAKVERYKRLRVEFFDVEGARQVFELEGLDARVVQHETDHLDGILFLDRIGKDQKEEDLLM
ncbi:peptide deformylase [Candidatus Peregrinibacteria bacterium]|nr:peptide deformylase [Candidatus Peregrinibacteria bacterium]